LLAELEVLVVDGNVIKRVPRRLKATRRATGGLGGGRALVAETLRNGLGVALAAHADGEINDVRLLGQLVPVVRARVPGPRLWVQDRQFCDLVQPQWLTQAGDEFLVRWHRRLCFARDTSRQAREGREAQGRRWVEDWGWLGGPRDPRRRDVRRLRLQVSARETLVLVSSLLDATRYPAVELLELYRGRWNIERVYQEVTEVFGLQRLIGSRAAATVFQLAFCLVLYNLIQVVRAYVAEGAERTVAVGSIEKLFQDVARQLVAWSALCGVTATVQEMGPPLGVAELRQWMGGQWRPWWQTSPPQKRRARRHTSVYRLVQAYRRHRKR
jgi:hypothetical protein